MSVKYRVGREEGVRYQVRIETRFTGVPGYITDGVNCLVRGVHSTYGVRLTRGVVHT